MDVSNGSQAGGVLPSPEFLNEESAADKLVATRGHGHGHHFLAILSHAGIGTAAIWAGLFEKSALRGYIEPMMAEMRRQIVPAEFPELNKLVWNRDPLRPVEAEEAYALYDRNWRFVDVEHMNVRERELIQELDRHFGNGFHLM